MEETRAIRNGFAPTDLLSYLDDLTDRNPLIRSRAIVAGGAIRSFYDKGGRPRDFDVFVPQWDIGIEGLDPDAAKLVEELLASYSYTDARKNRNVWTLKPRRLQDPPLQVCHWGFGSIEKLVDNFDFTVCQVAVFGDKIYRGPWFEADVEAQLIRVAKLPSPVHTLKRMDRYLQRGYRLAEGQLEAIAEELEPRRSGADEQWPDEPRDVVRRTDADRAESFAVEEVGAY